MPDLGPRLDALLADLDDPPTMRVDVGSTPRPSGTLPQACRPINGCALEESFGPPDDAEPEAFPVAGDTFLGFHLEEELGRGAFGRVYLARQGDLGGRPVVLKVARDIFGESRTLAQLQHSHVVPIY